MGGVISAPPNPRPDLYIPVEGSPLAADVKANFPSGCSVWLARTLPLSLLRRGYDKVGADDNPPLKQDVVEDEILMPVAAAIPARPDYPELKAKLYQPASLKESKAESPLIVFWHGGGFCMGSAGGGSHRSTCRFLAAETGFRVISLDYRLTSDKDDGYYYPTQIEDAFAGYEFVCSNPAMFGLPKDLSQAKVIFTGDSAGGKLCISTMFKVRDHNRKQSSASEGAGAMPTAPALFRPALVMPFYPATDRRTSMPPRDSAYKYYSGYHLTWEMIEQFGAYYFKGDASQYDKDENAHPILREDFSDLPEMIVVTAECDVVHDEGVAFYEKAKARGANVTHVESHCLPHGYLTHLEKWTTGRAKLAEMAAVMKDKITAVTK